MDQSVYVAVSSARVKMQDGRKERKIKTNKTGHQDRANLKKEQKMSLASVNRTSGTVWQGEL